MRLRIADCRLLIAVVVAAAAMLLSAGVLRADEIIERVLAVAGGDLIMMSDVRAARGLGLIDPGPASDADREVLTRRSERALVLAIDNRPERAEQRRRDRGVRALDVMPGAERDARHHHADCRTAEMLLEASQQECPLQFLADTPGDHDHNREERRLRRSLDHVLQRI